MSLLTIPPTPALRAMIQELLAEDRATGSEGALSESRRAALQAYIDAYQEFRAKQFAAYKAFGLIST